MNTTDQRYFVNKSRSKKIKQVRKKLGTFLIKSSYFIFLPFIFLGSYVISNSIQAETVVLTVIVTASSFIVAIMTGFLINSYYSIQQLRWEKLNRFTELQNQLRNYAEAFYQLTDAITRDHDLDWRFPESIEKLKDDSDWIYNDDDSVAIMFVRCLKDFAGLPHQIPDFELEHAIITEGRLEHMHDYIIQASSLLARYKWFKYILKSFKLPDTNNLDEVIITRHKFVEFAARKLKKEKENFWTLEFWEIQINKCEEILARMKATGKFVYSFNTFEIKRLGLNLLFLSVFGILLPITVLIANDSVPPYHQSFLTIVSGVGFMFYFILGVSRIYLKLSSSQLSYS